MSSGCCSRQPRDAQNSDSLKISCCSVTMRTDSAGVAHLAQHPRRFQLLLQVQVDQPPVRRLELARRRRRAAATRPAAPARADPAAARNCIASGRQLGAAARRRAAPAHEHVLARRHHRPGAQRPPRSRRTPAPDRRPAAAAASTRSTAPAVDRRAGGDRVDHRRAQPEQPLVGVRLRRPLVDQLGEVADVPERLARSTPTAATAPARRS